MKTFKVEGDAHIAVQWEPAQLLVEYFCEEGKEDRVKVKDFPLDGTVVWVPFTITVRAKTKEAAENKVHRWISSPENWEATFASCVKDKHTFDTWIQHVDVNPIMHTTEVSAKKKEAKKTNS